MANPNYGRLKRDRQLLVKNVCHAVVNLPYAFGAHHALLHTITQIIAALLDCLRAAYRQRTQPEGGGARKVCIRRHGWLRERRLLRRTVGEARRHRAGGRPALDSSSATTCT